MALGISTDLAAAPRRYRGAARDQRRDERRCRLLSAALQVYGERGYRHASVKAVCAAAGLTERYFYESFEHSDALLVACYEAVTQILFRRLAQTTQRARDAGLPPREQAQALLLDYFAALQHDPRSARVFLVEIRGVSAEVDRVFDASLQRFGQGLARVLAPPGAADDALLQAGVVGGVMGLALRWIAQGYRPAADQVAAAALRVCEVLASQR